MLRVKLSRAAIFDLHSKEVLDDGLRMWIGGESGVGKSNSVMLIASQLAMQQAQIIVLDAHGEHGALWELAPGRTARYGYADEPVGENSVEMCLQRVREGKSLLLDLSHWAELAPQKMSAFALELLTGLYEMRRKDPKQTIVFAEEAQIIFPQRQMENQMDTIRIGINIMTGGRKFGLYMVLASQRQSLVDSDVLESCNTRVFLRVTGKGDWKKIRPYLPEKLRVTFNEDRRTDINEFEPGEAILRSRWFPAARVRLLLPEVKVMKPQLVGM